MEIDDVLVATRDLAEGVHELASRHGLSAVAGGHHPGWGTANRIVPLGNAYLELVAVVDPVEARESAFGRWVADNATGLAEPFGWAVRVDDLDGVVRRHGLAIAEGSRVTPSGDTLRWRTAGLERAIAEPSLPFFIQWAPESSFPGASPRDEPDADGIARLVLSGAPEALAAWLGDHALPIEVRLGPPAVVSLVLERPAGETVLERR